ncbi:Coiled-coil domain-containing protein 43 [Porites harrisoni]
MAAGATIANGCPVEFEDWLSSRLKQLGLDEDVFGSYVTGVLDSEDTDEERKDALIGILEGMTEYPLDDLCNEVIDRWKNSRAEVLQQREQVKEQKAAEKQSKLAEIMEKQACTVSAMKPAQATSDGDMKKLLVAQYGHESDEELCGDSDEEPAPSTGKDPGLFKNVNVQSVADKEKEKRDKMKEENEQKKQQIKDAKEKQKQKAEERKEKEKKRTQKGERRR